MTRTEAAEKIAEAIEASGDYTASTWTTDSNGPVRVYVTIPAASYKKKARKIGFIAVNLDGTFESNLDVQSGTIMSMIPELKIEAVEVKKTAKATTEVKDEDETQFEQSAQAIHNAESAREQG